MLDEARLGGHGARVVLLPVDRDAGLDAGDLPGLGVLRPLWRALEQMQRTGGRDEGGEGAGRVAPDDGRLGGLERHLGAEAAAKERRQRIVAKLRRRGG